MTILPITSVLRHFTGQIKKERVRFFVFLVAAGMSVPVNLVSRALFSLVTRFDVAVVLSHLCGMVTAYALTKLFVFEHSGRSIRSEFARFTLVNMVSLAQTWIIAVGLVNFVWPMLEMTFYPELIAHFFGLSSSAITSYVGHKRLSFARSDKIIQSRCPSGTATTEERSMRFRWPE